jgi:DNA-binding NarL/FixJ family response regulator
MFNNDELQIDLSYWNGEEESRLKTLKLLLGGYSNNCIAKELNFSLKNIESIIAKLFRRSSIITRGAVSHLINPRAKMLALGVCKDWLRYPIQDKSRSLELLSRNQFLTLILCAAGCSNKAIAEFLCISSKTVESRLNALFNQFGVNSQSDKQVNPRIRLIVSAIKQKVLSPYSIKAACDSLNVEDWAEVVKNREQIKENFLRLQFEQSRPYVLQPESSLASLAERLQTPLVEAQQQQYVQGYYPQAGQAQRQQAYPPIQRPEQQNQQIKAPKNWI